eukprot:scaffold502812_cov47-Prasinocladus_malaysianus.AAC.1
MAAMSKSASQTGGTGTGLEDMGFSAVSDSDARVLCNGVVGADGGEPVSGVESLGRAVLLGLT